METALETYRAFDVIDDLEERSRVVHLDERMREIETCDGPRMDMFALVAAQEGIPAKTVERMFYAWRTGGALTLVDRRKVREARGTPSALEVFKTYCEKDKTNSMNAWRRMMADFRAGETFAIGTWRDVWSQEFPYEAAPARCPARWIPRGWGYKNLQRLVARDPGHRLALVWSRIGQHAALSYRLPVVKTRAGLLPGQVYEYDDVWHNVDVWGYGSGSQHFNPLEFAGYDVASAYKFSSFVKPRLQVVDPATGKARRDNLKEQQFRFLFACDMVYKGFHPKGVHVILEKGTTALRGPVLERIAKIPVYGKLIQIHTSGTLNSPAHKGLFIGDCGGNPHMKALCERSHGVIADAMSSVAGYHGRDAAHMHESTTAAVKYSAHMIDQVRRIDPKLLPFLALPTMEFDQYAAVFRAIEDEVMDRTDHSLEGWGDNYVAEYRLSEGSEDWRPMSDLAAMAEVDPAAAAATAGILNVDAAKAKAEGRAPALTRRRAMSRREVWLAGVRNLVRVPEAEMPMFLDPEKDVRAVKVSNEGLIEIRDRMYYGTDAMLYEARYVDRRGRPASLAPGETARFFANPLAPQKIWLVDEAGSLLGMAPLLKKAAWADERSWQEAMGRQQHDLAEKMREMRARHEVDAAKLAVEKAFNAAFVEAAKAAKAAPVGVGDAEPLTLAEMTAATRGASDAPDMTDDTDGGAEAEGSFLARMNRLSRS